MTAFICVACGTQYAPSRRPPQRCKMCGDDRQYVPAAGQQWTTLDVLQETHRLRIEPDHDLLAVGVAEAFAIPQRALVLDTDAGRILWDCISLVTDEARDRVGPIDLIAISHPHFYASMVEWSAVYGNVPILVHAADADWLVRSSPAVELWTGDRLALSPNVQLVHLPGHFPGSSALHWTRGDGRTVMTVGDSLHVGADRQSVSVMHSVPNHIPVDAKTIDDVYHRLDGLAIDDLYGFTWGRNIIGGAGEAVRASLVRYRDIVAST